MAHQGIIPALLNSIVTLPIVVLEEISFLFILHTVQWDQKNSTTARHLIRGQGYDDLILIELIYV